MALKSKIAAVEFDGNDVAVALVKAGGGQPKVLVFKSGRAVCSEEASEDERRAALVQTLKELFKGVSTQPVATVLCVSCVHSVVRMLRIPFKGQRKVAAAVQFELEPYLAFPIEDLVVDHWFVHEGEGQTDVFAVGLRRSLLEEQIDMLKEAGFEPEGICIDVEGLNFLWQATTRKPKGLRALFHIRKDGAVLTIVNKKAPIFFRYLPLSASSVYEAPQAVVREIQNSMRGFTANWRGGGEIAGITFTGVPLSDEMLAFYERELRMPLDQVDLLASLKCGQLAEAAEAGCITASAPLDQEGLGTLPEIAAQAESVDSPEEAALPEDVSALPLFEPIDEPRPPEAAVEPLDIELANVPAFSASDGDGAQDFLPEEDGAEASEWEAATDEAGGGEPEAPSPGAEALEPLPDEQRGPQPNAWAALVGSASCASAPGRFLDFRKDDLMYKGVWMNMLGEVTFAACLALVLLAVWAWHYYDARTRNLMDIAQLEAEVEAVQQEVEELQAQGVNVPVDIFGAPALLDVLAEIAGKMPDKMVHITDLKVERPSSQMPWITIKGEFEDDAAFRKVKEDLQKSEMFELDGEPALSLQQGKSTFVIKARRRGVEED